MTTTNASKSSSKSKSNGASSKKPTAGPGSGGLPKKTASSKNTPSSVTATIVNPLTKEPLTIEVAAEGERPAKDGKLPVARRFERMMLRAAARWAKLMQFSAGWDHDLSNAMGVTAAGIKEAVEAAKVLPDSFKPSKRAAGTGRVQLQAGQKVNVTEKAQKHYADILDAKEMVGLEVKRTSGKKVICKTSDGTSIIIPRGHLAPVKSIVEVAAELPSDDEEDENSDA